MVAILDADKEGYLRSTTSLVQTAGRAARHLNGKVYLYADVMTRSIKAFLPFRNIAARSNVNTIRNTVSLRVVSAERWKAAWYTACKARNRLIKFLTKRPKT